MTKKQFKKLVIIVCTGLFILNILLLSYLSVLKTDIETEKRTIENLTLERSMKDGVLLEKESEYKTLEENSTWLIEEKTNWQRQNQKLEDILH